MRLIKGKKIVLLFSMLIALSCSSYYELSKNEPYRTKLFLRGPGTCSQLILLDKNGKGKAMKGRTNDYYQDKFKKFETIEILTDFKINPDKLSEINALVEKIKSSDNVEGKFANDARRIEIFIDDEKKMDMYTWEPNILNDLIRKLSEYVPYDINSFCDPTTTF